jgi:hypothetical protein
MMELYAWNSLSVFILPDLILGHSLGRLHSNSRLLAHEEMALSFFFLAGITEVVLSIRYKNQRHKSNMICNKSVGLWCIVQARGIL